MSSSLRRDFTINLALGPPGRPAFNILYELIIAQSPRQCARVDSRARDFISACFHYHCLCLFKPARDTRATPFIRRTFSHSAPTLTDKECRRVSVAYAENANTSRQGRLFMNILVGDDFIFTNLTVSDKFLDLSDDKCP